MTRCHALSVALIAALGGSLPLSAQPPDPPKGLTPVLNVSVKNWTQAGRQGQGSVTYSGVVEKLEGRQVTLTCYHDNDVKPKSRTFEAVKVLADGKIAENTDGGWAYLWSDMQEGDAVELEVARDTEEDKQYVLAVLIRRRVGGRIPASQRPKGDEQRLGQCNVLNDIDNGLDVDDLEIAKWFPKRETKRVIPDVPPEPPPPPIPGGLNAEYKKKLDAIRAKKKEQELKATPPKKDDKK